LIQCLEIFEGVSLEDIDYGVEVDTVMGLDPSFRGSGVCILSLSEPLVIFEKISYKDRVPDTWGRLFLYASGMVSTIRDFASDYKPDLIGIEHPLPVGQWSGGLNLLGALIASEFLHSQSIPNEHR